MKMRDLGFTASDFETLSLPELYLRMCLSYQAEGENTNTNNRTRKLKEIY